MDLGVDLEHWFDLEEIPYTARYTRLFVRRDIVGLTVFEAAYERPLDASIMLSNLVVTTPDGNVVDWKSATPTGITTATGGRLIVDEVAVHVVNLPTGYSIRWVDAEGSAHQIIADEQGSVSIQCRAGVLRHARDAAARLDAQVDEWLGRCPTVSPRWTDVTRLCWWILGVNTLPLDTSSGIQRAVVPSKIGYVGLWQWDAYFIAIGLRHGDIDLAREQLQIAFSGATADGQLPDVVHEHGVLASSADLPPIDLENLRAMASPSLGTRPVPLTKPPLAALALAKVAEFDPTIIDKHLDTVLVAQEWWYQRSAHDGHPVYLHPYSSGLDDSPIFDHNAILESPDLTAYLILSDELIANWLDERGRAQEARTCRIRAERSMKRLLSHWDAQRGFFASVDADGTPVEAETIVSLMPLLCDALPSVYQSALEHAVVDPARFAGGRRLPTVSRRDRSFAPERMWRGPVWINTNWLVSEGLQRHGNNELADQIDADSLSLVMQSGPCEYFHPDTGHKPARATTAFGWSAALTVDLAVRLSKDSPGSPTN